VAWFVCLLGTAYLFYFVPKAFLPVGDSSFIRGVMVAQEGTSPDQMHAYQTQAEKIMRANPAVRSTFTMSGNSAFLGSNQAFLIAFLKDPSQRPPIQQVAGELMGGIAGSIPGTVAFLQPNPALEISTGATANAQGQFAFALSGIDPGEVYDTAGKLMAKMHEYPGFLFVNSDLYNHTPNLQVDILRDQAKLYGVSETRIVTLLHDAYSQNYSYLIKKSTDQYQVILEVADDQRAGPEDLGKLYIKSDDGQRMIPLNAVTSAHPVIGPQAVNHINQFTSVTMFFNLKPGYSIGPATQFVEASAKHILPPGVQGSLQGEALVFQNTVSDLAVLMLVAVFVMYVILAILYESYLHPITVLSSLPVALLGGLLTLWLFRQEASLYAYIGMFMLMGIVKKNGIMIVDFAEQRVRQGIKDDQAIHDASMERFRPIMMTTMAALLGALPIALGYGADGSSRRPLGLVVIGGLIVSQFVTLFVTPAIYLYLEEFQEKVLDRFSFFRSTRKRFSEVPAGTPAYALEERNGD
jgi:HAE1 family hydrophobic/amphiphilic exporter-1